MMFVPSVPESFILSWQIEYPTNVHLIRGNHEAADINALFGFRIECIERMVSIFTSHWNSPRSNKLQYVWLLCQVTSLLTNVPLVTLTFHQKENFQLWNMLKGRVFEERQALIFFFSFGSVLCRGNVMAYGHGNESISYLTGYHWQLW